MKYILIGVGVVMASLTAFRTLMMLYNWLKEKKKRGSTMKQQMRNLTYQNMQAAIWKIQAKEYDFEPSEKLA